MKAVVYVEGPADKIGLDVLLQPLITSKGLLGNNISN